MIAFVLKCVPYSLFLFCILWLMFRTCMSHYMPDIKLMPTHMTKEIAYLRDAIQPCQQGDDNLLFPRLELEHPCVPIELAAIPWLHMVAQELLHQGAPGPCDAQLHRIPFLQKPNTRNPYKFSSPETTLLKLCAPMTQSVLSHPP